MDSVTELEQIEILAKEAESLKLRLDDERQKLNDVTRDYLFNSIFIVNIFFQNKPTNLRKPIIHPVSQSQTHTYFYSFISFLSYYRLDYSNFSPLRLLLIHSILVPLLFVEKSMISNSF